MSSATITSAMLVIRSGRPPLMPSSIVSRIAYGYPSAVIMLMTTNMRPGPYVPRCARINVRSVRRCGTVRLINVSLAFRLQSATMVPLAVAIGVVAAAVGLFIFERFAGEHPLADLVYDVWLRRQDLDALDRASTRNPHVADVVVTLTTLPSRIDRIAPTLKSLLRQTVRPKMIRLNVPATSRRE